MTTILIATRNAHKVEEIRAILGTQFQFLTLDDFPRAPKVHEDAETFAGNAAKKSERLMLWIAPTLHFQSRLPRDFFALADDSGLEVNALNGAPGVHSARFAAFEISPHGKIIRDMINKYGEHRILCSGENAPDADNNAKLLLLLKDVPSEKRAARFRCALALTRVECREITTTRVETKVFTQIFDGACEGKILFEPRGENGFGYDPIFYLPTLEQTLAQGGTPNDNFFSGTTPH